MRVWSGPVGSGRVGVGVGVLRTAALILVQRARVQLQLNFAELFAVQCGSGSGSVQRSGPAAEQKWLLPACCVLLVQCERPQLGPSLLLSQL